MSKRDAGIVAAGSLARVARRLREPTSRARDATAGDATAGDATAGDATARGAPANAGIVAAGSLARVARRLREPTRERDATTRDATARDAIARSSTDTTAIDFVSPARPVKLELVSGRGHYDRVIAAVRDAHTSVWIATANTKELMIEGGRARPGRRRTMRRSSYVSVLAVLDDLAARGVELRLLHAEIPSGPFREELANHPRLVAGGLALRRCPRVHLKAVIVDGSLLYLGSANWTGAGLGAKGSGRRNFELGIVTDDSLLLDQVQSLYDHVWNGAECEGCKLRRECPGPLAELEAMRQAEPPKPQHALPRRSTIRRRNRSRLL